jgi:hypothetical protein
MVRDLWYVAVTGDDGTAKRDNSYWLKDPKKRGKWRLSGSFTAFRMTTGTDNDKEQEQTTTRSGNRQRQRAGTDNDKEQEQTTTKMENAARKLGGLDDPGDELCYELVEA